MVTRPFLPVLASLERKYALVVLREGPANGGTWHLRASPPHSAALWVIRQVERVTLLFAAAMAHAAAANASAGLQDPGLAMDQDVLARAIRVATTPGGSAFDWWEAYVKSAHKARPCGGRGRAGLEVWRNSTLRSPFPPPRLSVVAAFLCGPPSPSFACAQDHELWLQHPQEAPSRPTELWTDADLAGLAQQWPPPEDDGSEPPEQRARRAALRARLGAQTATQVVIRTPFDDEAYDEEGGDSGELLLQAPDWLWAHGDALEAGFASEVGVYHLLFTNKAFTPPRVGAHVGRWAAWLARPGMPSVPPLDPARPLLAANQRLVDAAAAAGFAQLRALLGMLATRAGLAGRTPVLPRLSCAQAWIAQDNTTQAGYRDHKVVDDGVWRARSLSVVARLFFACAHYPLHPAFPRPPTPTPTPCSAGATRPRPSRRATRSTACPRCTTSTRSGCLSTACSCRPPLCCTTTMTRRTRRRARPAPGWRSSRKHVRAFSSLEAGCDIFLRRNLMPILRRERRFLLLLFLRFFDETSEAAPWEANLLEKR